MSDTEASDEFWSAFSDSIGSASRDCECGRVYFDVANRYDGEWEIEVQGYLEKAKNQPEKYIPSDGSVSGVMVQGQFLVYHCECKRAGKFEAWIINHEQQLAEYLNARSKRLEGEAKSIKVGAKP